MEINKEEPEAVEVLQEQVEDELLPGEPKPEFWEEIIAKKRLNNEDRKTLIAFINDLLVENKILENKVENVHNDYQGQIEETAKEGQEQLAAAEIYYRNKLAEVVPKETHQFLNEILWYIKGNPTFTENQRVSLEVVIRNGVIYNQSKDNGTN